MGSLDGAGLAGAAFAGAGLVWADIIEVERMLNANIKTIRTANFLIFFLLSVKYVFTTNLHPPFIRFENYTKGVWMSTEI